MGEGVGEDVGAKDLGDGGALWGRIDDADGVIGGCGEGRVDDGDGAVGRRGDGGVDKGVCRGKNARGNAGTGFERIGGVEYLWRVGGAPRGGARVEVDGGLAAGGVVINGGIGRMFPWHCDERCHGCYRDDEDGAVGMGDVGAAVGWVVAEADEVLVVPAGGSRLEFVENDEFTDCCSRG